MAEILELVDKNGIYTTEHAWDRSYVTSQTLPSPSQTVQACRNGCPRCGQSQSLTSKYRALHFPDDFYALGYVLFCKFSQYHVNWKHVDACKDHFGSKVQVKKNAIIGQLNKMEFVSFQIHLQVALHA